MLHLYTLIVLAAMAPIVSVRSIICNGLLSHPLRPAELGSSGARNRVSPWCFIVHRAKAKLFCSTRTP